MRLIVLMYQQYLGIPTYREPIVLTLIVLMIHNKLTLSEIIRTTGISFDKVLKSTQGLLNLRIARIINYFNSDPLFKIIDFDAGRIFLENIAKLKVYKNSQSH